MISMLTFELIAKEEAIADRSYSCTDHIALILFVVNYCMLKALLTTVHIIYHNA